MKDWSREENRFGGAGPVLDFCIKFKSFEDQKHYQEWIKSLDLPHYQLYTGPYSEDRHPICSYIDKKYHDLPEDFYSGKVSAISRGTKCNSIDIYEDKISFCRSRANRDCANLTRKSSMKSCQKSGKSPNGPFMMNGTAAG